MKNSDIEKDGDRVGRVTCKCLIGLSVR